MNWFDGNGELTLIDCPGLSDTEGRDQSHLDEMMKDLKAIHSINTFIMLMTGDRLGNDSLMTNVKLLELLCGGKAVWSNIIVVITK